MTSESEGGLTAEQANAIWDVLVQHAGASEREDARTEFVVVQTKEFCREFRVMGDLYFGGKFWRDSGFRDDGSWGEKWFVNTDSETERKYSEIPAIIEQTNVELEKVRRRFMGEDLPIRMEWPETDLLR